MIKKKHTDFEIPDWMENGSQEDVDVALVSEDLDMNDSFVKSDYPTPRENFILGMIFAIPLHLIFWAIIISVVLWAFTLITDSVHFDWRFVGVISFIAAIITSWIVEHE